MFFCSKNSTDFAKALSSATGEAENNNGLPTQEQNRTFGREQGTGGIEREGFVARGRLLLNTLRVLRELGRALLKEERSSDQSTGQYLDLSEGEVVAVEDAHRPLNGSARDAVVRQVQRGHCGIVRQSHTEDLEAGVADIAVPEKEEKDEHKGGRTRS